MLCLCGLQQTIVIFSWPFIFFLILLIQFPSITDGTCNYRGDPDLWLCDSHDRINVLKSVQILHKQVSLYFRTIDSTNSKPSLIFNYNSSNVVFLCANKLTGYFYGFIEFLLRYVPEYCIDNSTPLTIEYG